MLTFGTDPEFFLSYKENNKEYCVPPVYFLEEIGVVPEIKDKKHPVFIKTPMGIKIHMDGCAFEFAVPTFKNAKEAKSILDEGLFYLEEFGSKYNFKLYKKPTINFDVQKFIFNQSEHFQNCCVFGCDRDWDAFDYINYNSETVDAFSHPKRYGGGHLHISGIYNLENIVLPLVKTLALYVGNFITANSLFPVEDNERTFLYGKPGKFRPQQYPDGQIGIEYRTPSNMWASFPEETIQEFLNHAERAVNLVQEENKCIKLLNKFSKDTVLAITNSNKELALNILKELP